MEAAVEAGVEAEVEAAVEAAVEAEVGAGVEHTQSPEFHLNHNWKKHNTLLVPFFHPYFLNEKCAM